MTKLYDAYIHDTTIHHLTLEATDEAAALARVSKTIEHDRTWRSDADLIQRGAVHIHSIHQSDKEPPLLKPYAVTFSEYICYRSDVQARDAEHAISIVVGQIEAGGPDSLEETHNERSEFNAEEVVS